MADDKPVPLDSVESILSAIIELPERERLQLIDHMKGNREWLLGHVMVSIEIRDYIERIAQGHLRAVREFSSLLVEKANEADRRGKCAKTKAEKTEARNKLIDEGVESGIDEKDDQALFDYVRQRDATLLWRNQKEGKSQKETGLISPESMMKGYRRHKTPRDNRNRPG
jgi:hypothetical protein